MTKNHRDWLYALIAALITAALAIEYILYQVNRHTFDVF